MYEYKFEFVKPDSVWSANLETLLLKAETLINEKSLDGWELDMIKTYGAGLCSIVLRRPRK